MLLNNVKYFVVSNKMPIFSLLLIDIITLTTITFQQNENNKQH